MALSASVPHLLWSVTAPLVALSTVAAVAVTTHTVRQLITLAVPGTRAGSTTSPQ